MTAIPDIAISVRQPWAWAILALGKDIENRPRRTNYRGPVAIHASSYRPSDQDVLDFMEVALPATKGFAWDGRSAYRGGIVGVVDIIDCVDTSNSRWFSGPYGYVLRSPRFVPFVLVPGALGFFNWRKMLEKQANA